MIEIPLIVLFVLIICVVLDDMWTEEQAQEHRRMVIDRVLVRYPERISLSLFEDSGQDLFLFDKSGFLLAQSVADVDTSAYSYLKPEILLWADENLNGDLRTLYDPSRACTHLLFSDPSDAFSFKMRWL
jgi:hypothetical protein